MSRAAASGLNKVGFDCGLGVLRGEYWSFQSLITSCCQKVSVL